MAGPGRKQDVELVEGDSKAFDDGASDDDARDPAEPRWGWRRIARAWPIAVVGLLVASAYAVAGVRADAERERMREALSDQQGYIGDLARPLQHRWTFDGVDSFPHVVSTVGGTLIVSTEREGQAVVIGLDADTGAELWVTNDEADSSRHCGWPLPDEYESGPAVACLISRYSFADYESSTITVGGSVVEHRDAATGELIAASGGLFGRAQSVWGVGFAGVESSDGATVVQYLSLDGAPVWATRLLDRELRPDESSQLYALGEYAALTVGDRAFVVDAAGQVVVDHQFDPATEFGWFGSGENSGRYYGHIDVFPGGFGVFDAQQPGRTTVYDEQGTLRFQTEGGFNALVLDDGSAGEVFALDSFSSGALVLFDMATGEELLRREGAFMGGATVLDRSLVYGMGGALRSLDLDSGEERWSVPSTAQIVAADGMRVLVYERDGANVRLRVLDLDSGSELWELPHAPGESWAEASDGALYVVAEHSLTRYGS